MLVENLTILEVLQEISLWICLNPVTSMLLRCVANN